QDSINGTVGQAVLLPVSYRFGGAPRFPVPIQWTFSASRDPLISCTVLNCSLGAGGIPSSCSVRCFPHALYRSRVELFPENGSLLLRDLRLSDSGVYGISFTLSPPTRLINLTVHEPRFAPHHPGPEPGGGEGTAARVPCYVLGGCYCFILLLLQLLFHL
ncbi:HECAM protein, partial [Podilymbus podiceps]|nr:HECAM protein [Podilymbus podiceps]